jgi:4-amino-4-deoxy-L-arabinose transferase-like glycosyltransferase
MNRSSFFLAHYFAIGLFALLAYLFGRRLTWQVKYHSLLEQACFSTALGLGLISYLTLLLGMFGVLYPSVVLIVLLMGFLVCYPVWVGWPSKLVSVGRKIRTHRKTSVVIVIGLITLVIALLPMWFLPLYPPTAFDETMYHLPSARAYVEHHRIIFTPHLRYPTFPQTNNMLFTLALLMFDDVSTHLVQFLLMVILTLAIISFGQRFLSHRAGLWAAAILLGNPLVLWCGSVAYIEMGLMLFVFLGVYAFWNWWQKQDQQWLVLAGVFCGLAIGTKYLALFFLIALQIAALYAGFRRRKYLRPFVFGVVALMVASPWFARNFYYMRNPVFPFFYKSFARVFGPGRLDPEFYAGMLLEPSYYGIGKTFQSLVTLPWHLSFNQEVFVMEAPLSTLYLYLIPLLAISIFVVARIRGLLILTAAYTLFWFFTGQVLRYLLPALTLISLAAGAALDWILCWAPLSRKWTNHRVITVGVFALLMAPGWIYAWQNWQQKGPLPVTKEQRVAYLTARFPSYPAYELLNSLKGRNYTLYAFHDASMAYFADGLFMGDWFGPDRYALIDANITSGRALYSQLKALGADHFLRRAGKFVPELPTDEFFNSNFKPLYLRSDIALYEITDRPFQQRMIDVLQNPGFEELKEGQPVGWRMAGSPMIDTSGKQSASGAVAVRSNGASDVVYQSLGVNPGESFMFSCQARSSEKGQTAKLQINWLDTEDRILGELIEVIKPGPSWQRNTKNVMVPEQASKAIIYLSALDQSSVWFDDISFGKTAYIPQP